MSCWQSTILLLYHHEEVTFDLPCVRLVRSIYGPIACNVLSLPFMLILGYLQAFEWTAQAMKLQDMRKSDFGDLLEAGDLTHQPM